MASWLHDPRRLSETWIAYRQAGAGYPPLWHPGSTVRPTSQPEARWHKPPNFAQYFALETDGAWSELVRYEGIRTETDRVTYQSRLWQAWVRETEIADLQTFDAIEGAGLPPERFIEDNHAWCQALGEDLVAAGYRGLLTPSAAIVGVVNLTLFGPRRELYGRPSDVLNRRPDFYININRAADPGPPPGHILGSARLIGDPHLGYEAWRAP